MIYQQEDAEEVVIQAFSLIGPQMLARIALMEQLLMRLQRPAKLALEDAEHVLTTKQQAELNVQVAIQIW